MIRFALPAIVLLGLPFALSEFWTFIAIEVLAFALYAVSFNVLLGYGGMLSFGHAAFFGVGGYAAAILVKKTGLPAELAFALVPLAALAISAAFAVLIGFFSVQRSGIYFAMLTFAVPDAALHRRAQRRPASPAATTE